MIPILIPVYGNLGYTERCLKSIWHHTRLPYRIIIIDDCSPPGEKIAPEWVEALEGYSEERPVTILYHERNRGCIPAWNTGTYYAIHSDPAWKFCVFLNNDTEVLPGWLEALRETIEQAQKVGVVGAKLLSMDDPDQIIHGGTLDLMGTHKGGRESQGHCAKRTDEVWVTWACVAIPREVLIRCGLPDDNYENFCTDSDYCLHVRSRGYRVIYQPKCRVLHKQSATVMHHVTTQKLQRDQQRLLDKWGGAMLKQWANELPMGILRGQGK